MENTLDTRARRPKAGHVPIQRLNRTEYVASVKALVGVELKAADVLPQDLADIVEFRPIAIFGLDDLHLGRPEAGLGAVRLVGHPEVAADGHPARDRCRSCRDDDAA